MSKQLGTHRAPGFDPTAYGFVLMADHRPAGAEVDFYEHRSHPSVDGKYNFYRLNVYLSQDGEFVNAWFGLLEPWAIEILLSDNDVELTSYQEPLFREYIASEEQARHIVDAIRINSYLPQILVKGSENGIHCRSLDEENSEVSPYKDA